MWTKIVLGIGKDATWTSGNVWMYSWAAAGDVEIKPLLNDQRWSTGGNYRIHAGATLDIYPFFGASHGSFVQVPSFASPPLGNRRTLIIYLPPSYRENALKRYPVLYMHDGQNLFDAATSAFGTEWQVDEHADAAVAAGQMDEAIIVGVNNTANRIWEYLARRNPGVFGKAGCMSSSFWWNNQALTISVEHSTAHLPVRLYLDAGTSSDGLPETTRMNAALVADDYVQGADLDFVTAQGGSHNEASWAARVGVPLAWLFPWQSTP